MEPTLDPDHFRLSPSLTPTIKPPRRPPRHRLHERFLKGPIPWAWLDRAGQLPGKALAVGLILWRKAGITEERTVRLCQARPEGMGLNQDSTRRGVRELERAGLITVQRLPGRGLEITLLDVRDWRRDDV